MVQPMKHLRFACFRRTSSLWLLLAAAPLAGAQTPSAAPAAQPPGAAAGSPAPLTPEEAGYTIGLSFGEQLRRAQVGDQVDIDTVVRGMKDGLKGKNTTPADQQQIKAFVRLSSARAVARNESAAKDFLARNAHEKGVITTASGLQYKVIEAGDLKAAAVMPLDEVSVQYRGTLLDGTEFDSTYTSGKPVSFRVNGVISGWQEALVLMKPGAKWQLFMPPELGYGANGSGAIPGGSLLIFEVKLVSVKPNTPPAAAAPPTPASKSAPKSN